MQEGLKNKDPEPENTGLHRPGQAAAQDGTHLGNASGDGTQ